MPEPAGLDATDQRVRRSAGREHVQAHVGQLRRRVDENVRIVRRRVQMGVPDQAFRNALDIPVHQ